MTSSLHEHVTTRCVHFQRVPVMRTRGHDAVLYCAVCGAVKGTRRVNVLMKRGGQALQDHMKRVIDQSGLHEPDQYAKDLDERGRDAFSNAHFFVVVVAVVVVFLFLFCFFSC